MNTILLVLAHLIGTGGAAWRCSIAMEPRSIETQAAEATVAFVGVVLDIEHERGSESGMGLTTTTFLVERRWKGPAVDTIRVNTWYAGCPPHVRLGATHVILAYDDGPDRPPKMRLGSHAADLSSVGWNGVYADSIMQALGAPQWVADPPGTRTYDRPGPSGAAGKSVRLAVSLSPKHHQNVTVTLAGTGQVAPQRNGFFIFDDVLEGKLDRLRISAPGLPDEDHYIRPRCGVAMGMREHSSGCTHQQSLFPGGTVAAIASPRDTTLADAVLDALIMAAGSGDLAAASTLSFDPDLANTPLAAVRATLMGASHRASLLARLGSRAGIKRLSELLRCTSGSNCSLSGGGTSVEVDAIVLQSADAATLHLSYVSFPGGKAEWRETSVALKKIDGRWAAGG